MSRSRSPVLTSTYDPEDVINTLFGGDLSTSGARGQADVLASLMFRTLRWKLSANGSFSGSFTEVHPYTYYRVYVPTNTIVDTFNQFMKIQYDWEATDPNDSDEISSYVALTVPTGDPIVPAAEYLLGYSRDGLAYFASNNGSGTKGPLRRMKEVGSSGFVSGTFTATYLGISTTGSDPFDTTLIDQLSTTVSGDGELAVAFQITSFVWPGYYDISGTYDSPMFYEDSGVFYLWWGFALEAAISSTLTAATPDGAPEDIPTDDPDYVLRLTTPGGAVDNPDTSFIPNLVTLSNRPELDELGDFTITTPNWQGIGTTEVTDTLYGTAPDYAQVGSTLNFSPTATIRPVATYARGRDPLDPTIYSTVDAIWNNDGSAIQNPRTASDSP